MSSNAFHFSGVPLSGISIRIYLCISRDWYLFVFSYSFPVTSPLGLVEAGCIFVSVVSKSLHKVYFQVIFCPKFYYSKHRKSPSLRSELHLEVFGQGIIDFSEGLCSG